MEEERVPRINELNIRVKPDHYLQLAHTELEKDNNIGAIQYYMLYIQNLTNPQDMKLNEQINLTKLIINLSSNLNEFSGEIQNEIMKCYLSALNIFPENALLLNAFGLFFFTQGEYTVSRSYFQRSAATGYLPGEKNFLHVIWHLIPRWHFRMLNDKNRNKSYQLAIDKAVKEGYKKVYDIGAGCGLLSLIAAKSSPDVEVIAFEESKILSDIAANVFKRNNFKNIRLINSNSNSISIAPAPCNLIVTEIFDAGVFGEHCLETIKHALENFVSEEKFKIIPGNVKIFITGIESTEIMQKYRYVDDLKELKLENLCLLEDNIEIYDADYLKNRKVKFATETKSFLSVDFYNLEQINQLLNADNNCCEKLDLICLETGYIHAFAVWFELNLDDEIRLSTDPYKGNCQCWEQAIFRLDHPIEIKKGQSIKVQPKIIDGQISFSLLENSKKSNDNFMEVSKEIITFLNDKKLVQCVIKMVDSFKNCQLRVLDFNVFPLFGFLMAKKGATVYHVYKDECDLKLFNCIMTVNEIPSNKLIFIHHKALEEYLVLVEPPDIIYTDFIKTDGSWNKTDFTLETEGKFNCELIPKKVFLNAQLINSKYLDFCNKVDDGNTLNFEISTEINEFSGNEHPNLDRFEYEKLSKVVLLDISDLDKFDFHGDEEIIKNGVGNAILYWFELQFTDDESNKFSTLDSTFYDKCCTLLNKPKNVKKGDRLMFNVMRFEGHLKVYCD